MLFKSTRFGIPYNPKGERREKNRIMKNIIIFLCVFIIIAVIFAVGFAILIQNNITCFAVNDKIDSTWISSLASYWGGNHWWLVFRSFCFFRSFLYNQIL